MDATELRLECLIEQSAVKLVNDVVCSTPCKHSVGAWNVGLKVHTDVGLHLLQCYKEALDSQ